MSLSTVLSFLMKYHVYIVFRQSEPQSGLLEGGTLVTITGTNLGFRVDQVSNVTVAGVPCTVVDYDVSTTLVSCIQYGWLGVVTVRASDLRSSGRGFYSWWGRYQAT